MRDSILKFVLLAAFLGIFIPAFAGAAAGSATTFSVANEAVSISTASWTSVDEDAQSYFDNETVYYNGSVVAETEYRWATENGSIQAVNGGTLDGASQVEISYSGERQNQWTRLLIPMLFLILTVLIVVVLWVAGDAAVSGFGAGGGR